MFHILDIAAVMVIIGVVLSLFRRMRDQGAQAVQSFAMDFVPLIMLFAISLTGIALTVANICFDGIFYDFLSILHAITVVAALIYLPFGKFFHIVQRPASIGVTLYQIVNQDVEHYGPVEQTGRCRRCETVLPSQQFVDDLKATLADLGQSYDLGPEHAVLQDYCPTCKRVLRGQAYFQMMGKRFV